MELVDTHGKNHRLTMINSNEVRVMDKINAYKEILDVIVKHDDLLKDDHPIAIKSGLINRIKLQEISEEFDIEIKDNNSNPNSFKLSEYEWISLYGDCHNRTISWSDDGNQPDNERLYVISFSTGPYVFGSGYPEKTFKKFFDELKSYKPKYSDTHNDKLYFTAETARHIHEDFNDLFNKYKNLVSDEMRVKKIDDLEIELEKLKSV